MPLRTALTGELYEQILVTSQSADAYGFASSSPTTWSSSNNGIATVQKTIDVPGGALIICQAVGTATITATAGSTSAVFNLTVVNTVAGVATSIEVGLGATVIKKLQ